MATFGDHQACLAAPGGEGDWPCDFDYPGLDQHGGRIPGWCRGAAHMAADTR